MGRCPAGAFKTKTKNDIFQSRGLRCGALPRRGVFFLRKRPLFIFGHHFPSKWAPSTQPAIKKEPAITGLNRDSLGLNRDCPIEQIFTKNSTEIKPNLYKNYAKGCFPMYNASWGVSGVINGRSGNLCRTASFRCGCVKIKILEMPKTTSDITKMTSDIAKNDPIMSPSP